MISVISVICCLFFNIGFHGFNGFFVFVFVFVVIIVFVFVFVVIH